MQAQKEKDEYPFKKENINETVSTKGKFPAMILPV